MLVLMKGDVFNVVKMFPERVALGHGCNCFNTFGKGIAITIKTMCPNAYREDCKTSKGDRTKLGNFTYSDEVGFRVYNLYTQYTWNDKSDMFYIDAFESAVIKMIEHAKLDGINRLVIPAIGLGLANGKLHEIVDVLSKLFYGRKDVALYWVIYDEFLFESIKYSKDSVDGVFDVVLN